MHVTIRLSNGKDVNLEKDNRTTEAAYLLNCVQWAEENETAVAVIQDDQIIWNRMDELLNELYTLTLEEYERDLNEQEKAHYLELVETLHSNNIDIPFGIEI